MEGVVFQQWTHTITHIHVKQKKKMFDCVLVKDWFAAFLLVCFPLCPAYEILSWFVYLTVLSCDPQPQLLPHQLHFLAILRNRSNRNITATTYATAIKWLHQSYFLELWLCFLLLSFLYQLISTYNILRSPNAQLAW